MYPDWLMFYRTDQSVTLLPKLYAAGGVPEVMLHLRSLGLINTDVLTATGQTLDENPLLVGRF
ncbi:MAG: hypothetical protein Ct9H300mP19_16010 [Dehalococcoidia bacterium]|nr:MAG: hypothetical protein Ct9H300mP19_16010 [Dehalococcoidia bacterium]